MKKEIYNPLFESLLNTVKDYKPVYTHKIQEAVDDKFENEKQALKYIKNIADSFISSIFYFAGACPIGSTQREITKEIFEKMQSIKTNATIDELISSMVKFSNDSIVNKIKEQKKSKKVIPVYEEFLKGIGLLEEAYSAYKKRAANLISSPTLIKGLNDHIKEAVKNAIDSTNAANTKIK